MIKFSDNYIKMAEKAVEVQAAWSASKRLKEGSLDGCDEGDYFLDKGYKKVYFYGQVSSGTYCVDPLPIWLPRQDQLQEMITPDLYGWESIDSKDRLDFFYGYIDGQGDPEYSMEELWLAFVMKEKYGKSWNGEDWIEPDCGD